MEQLVKDAASYKDEQKELNETVDAGSMSFANIVKAIDVVQKHQGIAGTTAKEAATTVEGSLNMVKSAWDNVVTAIGTGKGLDTAINDLITSLIGDGSGKGGLINNIMPVIQRSMEGIGKLISESAPIIAKYLPGLIETLIPPVVQSIATLAAAIIADIPVIAKAIWDAFGKSINDLAKKYPLFGKIVSSIKTALDILLPILKGAIPIVAAFVAAFAFVKIASGIATFISTIQSVVSGIGMFITAIRSASSVFALLQGIFIANPFGLIVAGIMAAVAAGVALYQNWDTIKAGAAVLGEKLQEVGGAIADFFAGIGKKIGEVWNYIISIPGKLADFAASIGAWIVEAIPKLIDQIVQFFAELPSKIGYAIGFVIGTLVKWQIDVIQWIITNVPKIIESIVKFFRDLPGKIYAAIVFVVKYLANWVVMMWNYLKVEIPKVITGIVKFFAELPGKIWSWLLKTIGKVADFASSLWSKGTEAGRKFASNLVDAVKGLPDKFFDIGKNIVKGVWNGIQSVGKWIKDQIGGFFGGIVQGVKDGLEIHSPSKVFAGIGEMMARGLGVGWDDQYGSIQKQIQSGLNFDAGRITGSFGVTESSTSNDANQKLDDLSALLQEWLPQMANMQMVMDSGETVGALAPKMTTAISRRLTTKYR